jgi:hypothetical protein
MILPISAFSPGGEPDFHAEGLDSPQTNLVHECEYRWFLITPVLPPPAFLSPLPWGVSNVLWKFGMICLVVQALNPSTLSGSAADCHRFYSPRELEA